MRPYLRYLMAAALCGAACGCDDESASTGGSGGQLGTGAAAAGGGGTASGGGQLGIDPVTGGGANQATGDTGAHADAGTGGMLDSGTLDGGTGTGTGCDAGDYLLCEDFESAADGALPAGWSAYGGWAQGQAVVTSAQAHGGSRALASASATSGQPRAAHSLASLGAAANTHWGRIFYRVGTPPTLPGGGGVIHNTLVGLASADGQDEARVVDTVVNGQGAHQFLYNLPDDSCCGGSSYDYRSYDGQWHCAEWFIDANAQAYAFYFDGTEVSSIGFEGGPTGGGDARIGNFGQVVLGWINYQQADPPYEAWFDDLVIDDERIGCR